MKKITAILLSVSLVFAMTACGTDGAAAPETAGSTAETAAEAKTTEAAATEASSSSWKEEHPTWLCEDKTTLRLVTYDSVNGGNEPPSNDQRFWQMVEDYTNVHIDWEVVPYAGYEEVIQARLAAATDLPDIINVYTGANALQAGRNGILVNFADYWDTCFTNTTEYFAEEGTDYKTLISNGDGSIYAFYGTTEPVEGHITLCYNTEWMEKLGADIPRTLDEFTALLEKMKAAGDLNGNGIDDEIVFTGADMQKLYSALGTAFDLEAYLSMEPYAVRDGANVYDEYTCDNQKAYLAYLNELYKKGLIDPEICSMTASTLSEKCASDRVGVFAYYTAFAISYGAMTTAGQNDPLGEHFTLGYPLASEYNNNEAYFTRREVVSNSLTTAVSADSENKELAMKWLDTVFADKNLVTLRTCGIEGETYTLNADGSKTLIQPADGSSWESVEGGNQITIAFIQTKEQLLNTKQEYGWYLDEYDYLRENFTWKSPTIVHVVGYSNEEQDIIDMYNTDIKTYYAEARDQFVKGDLNIEADWDKYLSTMEQLGVKEMVKAWQSVYDRTK